MNLGDALGHHRVGDAALRRSALAPGIEAAGGDAQDTAHGAHGEVGLVRNHESEDFVDVASPLPANQAVAFARRSRSCCNWRTWRRSRLSSARSAVLKPTLPDNGLPLSLAAWPTQLVMDCAVTLNSRESSAGVRPARTSSTICCLDFSGYGGLALEICGSLNTKNDVSTEPGQLQLHSLVLASPHGRSVDDHELFHGTRHRHVMRLGLRRKPAFCWTFLRTVDRTTMWFSLPW